MQFGSLRHGAMLYESARAFERGLVWGFDSARVIEKKVMNEAVEECVEAAVEEFDGRMQRGLMMAASYGMTFINRETEKENLNNKINTEGKDDTMKWHKTFTMPGPTYTSK